MEGVSQRWLGCVFEVSPKNEGLLHHVWEDAHLSDAAVTIVVDLAKAFERVQLSVVWHWAKQFWLSAKNIQSTLRNCAHARKVIFENEASEPSVTVTVILPGSIWSVLLLRIVKQEAMSNIIRENPEQRVSVGVDLVQKMKNLYELLKKDMESVKLKLYVTENGKQGKCIWKRPTNIGMRRCVGSCG